jgi:hypothetical protein
MDINKIIESEGWKSFVSKLEKFGALTLLFGIVQLALKNNPDKLNVLLICGFSTLAIVYFFYGFKELTPANAISSSFFKIYGWGLAISCVSLMFTLMEWPIDKNSLIISIVIVLVSILLGLKLRNDENKNLIDKFYFIRLVIALILLSFVYYKIRFIAA